MKEKEIKLYYNMEERRVECEMKYGCDYFVEIKEFLKNKNFYWCNPLKIWYRKDFYSEDLKNISEELGKWDNVLLDPSLSPFGEMLINNETRNYEHSFSVDCLGLGPEWDSFEEDNNISGDLYKFQKSFLEYMEKTGNTRVLLADQMGLGKSLMAISFYQLKYLKEEVKKLLIVCPASLKLNWQRELNKWIGGKLSSLILFGWDGDEKLEDSDVVIINYSIFEKRKEYLKTFNFDMLILDEVHLLKNYKSKRYRAISDFVKKSDLKYIFALSGTPFLNYPKELITLLQLFGKLNYFGGFWQYMNKYCDAGSRYIYVKGGKRQKIQNWNGINNLDDLRKRLRSLFMIRREKSEVLDLPEKREMVVYFDMDKEYKEKYEFVTNNVREYFLAKVEGDEKKWKIINKWIDSMKRGIFSGKFDKIRNMLDSSWGEVLSQIEALKQVTAESKLEPAREWIHNFLDTTNEKIVIFTRHHNILNGLVEEFEPWGVRTIEGKQKAEVRQMNIDDFQEKDDVRLMIANLRAGGIGITLSKASTVVFMEMDWNYATHEQGADRLHRLGQNKRVDVYYFITGNTIDEWLYEMIINKKEAFDQVFKNLNREEYEENMLQVGEWDESGSYKCIGNEKNCGKNISEKLNE